VQYLGGRNNYCHNWQKEWPTPHWGMLEREKREIKAYAKQHLDGNSMSQ
jgi:hypothetical protein